MIGKFSEHIEKYALCSKSDNILLAVSGGMDSVVMAELFHMAGYKFAITHCNFHLRDTESDADEFFVRELASKKYKTRCFVAHFDTKKYARQKKLTVQEAARELRYNFFEETLAKEGFDSIATAHHADDQIETFFINLLRGSGITGLSGIPVKHGNIIRPMLFAFRKDIESFVKNYNLKYRTDSSNNENKYLRNKIRNNLLPLMEQLYPNYRQSIQSAIGNLKNTDTIYRNHLENISPLKPGRNGLLTISIKELIKLTPTSSYLFEFISPYGFNKHVCEDICSALENISGKTFFSKTHRLVKDREHLLIEELNATKFTDEYILTEETKQIDEPVKLTFTLKGPAELKSFITDDKTALLNRDLLKYPLTLRKWKKGDIFYPYGMKGKKKLSDFFSNDKLSVIEKSSIWLLCSENKIVWVIGMRIDDRFKIKKGTHTILQVKLLE